MKVGYLGPKGTFSEEAAYSYFTEIETEMLPFPTIYDVLDEVEAGTIDKAIVPIENTIEGSIVFTVDRLADSPDLFVQGEVTLMISQHLLVNEQTKLENIREVWSVSPAIAQCRKFIKKLQAGVKLYESTANAALEVKKSGRTDVGAIASKWAAEQHKLQILASDIQDSDSNQTRFIIVTKGENPPEHPQKTMLQIIPGEEHQGVLANILQVFSAFGLNLIWIESRPTKLRLGTYQFYLDIEAGMDDERIVKSLSILKTMGHHTRILGSY